MGVAKMDDIQRCEDLPDALADPHIGFKPEIVANLDVKQQRRSSAASIFIAGTDAGAVHFGTCMRQGWTTPTL